MARRIGYAVLSLVLIVALGGVGVTYLLTTGGYCAEDFLPFETHFATDPYVQHVTDDAASVLWRTTEESQGTVSYGETEELGQAVESEAARRHQVRLEGLEPDTEYFYQVEGDGVEAGTRAFRTAPGPGGTITAAVFGDSGTGGRAQYAVASLLRGFEPDLVLHTGDVVYRRGAECENDAKFFAPYRDLIAAAPIYPAIGNHDLMTRNGEPYLRVFDLPTNNPDDSERYYSFDYGPAHIVTLNSEVYHTDGAVQPERQREWLIEDLRASDRPWTIVVLHRPAYSSSPHHAPDPDVLADLAPVFEEEGVDVVFAGHVHLYERFQPINGVTHIITGGGGADLHPAGESELSEYAASVFHALRVEIGPARLVIEAVRVDGAVIDRVELRK